MNRGVPIVQRQLYHREVLATTVDLDALGRIGTALADETRRQLLVQLLEGPGYPAELVELALPPAGGCVHDRRTRP